MSISTFQYCCNDPNKMQYNIIHQPKPIEMIPELRRSIERMLWYVPGIPSVQSEQENYLIDDPLYSDAVFDMVLETMNISREMDVKIETRQELSTDDFAYYANSICVACQKLILTKYTYETTLRAMLRHIRNAIAHGNFNVIDNLVLFIDENRNNKTSIIKIDILALDRVLKQVEAYNGITQEKVLSNVFRNLGYEVKSGDCQNNVGIDMILQKGEKNYGAQIKVLKRHKRLGYRHPMIESLL